MGKNPKGGWTAVDLRDEEQFTTMLNDIDKNLTIWLHIYDHAKVSDSNSCLLMCFLSHPAFRWQLAERPRRQDLWEIQLCDRLRRGLSQTLCVVIMLSRSFPLMIPFHIQASIAQKTNEFSIALQRRHDCQKHGGRWCYTKARDGTHVPMNMIQLRAWANALVSAQNLAVSRFLLHHFLTRTSRFAGESRQRT